MTGTSTTSRWSLTLLSICLISLDVDRTTATNCAYPSETYGDFSCISMVPLEKTSPDRTSRQTALEACKKVTIGNWKWSLPRVDTLSKMIRIVELINKSSYYTSCSNGCHFWTSLRRSRERGLDGKETRRYRISDWTDDKYWEWDGGGKLSELQAKMTRFPWMSGQPDNKFTHAYLSVSYVEACVVGMVNHDEKRHLDLKFYDSLCSFTPYAILANYTNDVNLKVCEAVVRLSAPMWKQWWFYLVLLFFSSLTVAIMSCFCMVLRRRRRNRARGRQPSRARQRRSAASRTSLFDISRFSFRNRRRSRISDDTSTVGSGGGGAKPTTTAVAAAAGSNIGNTDQSISHHYSNVEILGSRSKPKPAPDQGKIEQSTAVKSGGSGGQKSASKLQPKSAIRRKI